ncbi:hypothetical protein, conserved [Eimeria tenella]|uniref:Prefoldin subunit 2 n=1 Tax=Eimeria tenella TaxID=5802 RepID=U6KRV3_EIMTE|nr:hypothetical protein, conserved [Eimeria tenella]CDJ39084.1 hypothetical protein, conserved [Eimeria tenella]|eukprot:XP_013229839.1 hypothetical protein, conserved [Eimeria tenella]
MAQPQGAPRPSGEEDLKQRLQRLEKERIALNNTIEELRQDSSDHQLVLDAFKDLEPSRRCYRLVGGVLVERSVGEVQPALEQHKAKVAEAMKNLEAQLANVQSQLAAASQEYIKRTGSADVPYMQQQQQAAAAKEDAKSKSAGGILV